MKTLVKVKNMMRLLVAMGLLMVVLGATFAVSAQSSCGSTYVVQSGDYLTKIARTCGVSYSDLLKANPAFTHPSLIYKGQVLHIPARIQFASGATAANVQGHVAANGQMVYLLNAGAGQTLEMSLTAPASLSLAIYGADGSTVKSTSDSLFFRGVLPKSQDYRLVISAGSSASDFSMSVVIPARIRFATGATSTTLTGTIPANLSQYFILRAAKGQTLNVSATPDDELQLILYGVDGSVLKSGMGGGASFSGALPSTQDYILALRAVNAGQAYTLKVSVPEVLPIPVTGSGSYTVQKGDTLYSIAVAHKTTVAVLLRANPEITNRNVIAVGQVIYLPGATLTLSNGQVVYIVRSGDYMNAIAAKFNTTLSALLNANPQISRPNLIYTGQRINIP